MNVVDSGAKGAALLARGARPQRTADLTMTVTRGCGTVEVRVSGPGATLRLFFDPWELPPVDVRRVVNAAVERYRSSFLARTP